MNEKQRIEDFEKKMETLCAYLGCNRTGEILDDIEIAPGVIEKKLVCNEHKGQLIGNITMMSKHSF